MDTMPTQNTVANGSQMPPLPPERKPIGPMAGAIIVVGLLVLGGLYFWGAKLDRVDLNTIPYIPGEEVPQDGVQLESDTSAGFPPQGDSDDAASIESDFNAIDIDQMESQNNAELNNI